MEYFDVVDINRKFLNKKLPRGSKLQENEFNIGIECLIVNSEKKVLLTQRAPNKSHSYQWEIPGGCSISGETSVQTLKREIFEEIGIKISNYKLISTLLYKYQFIDFYLTYLNFNVNNLTLQKEEILQAQWYSLEQLQILKEKELLVPSTLIFFETIEKILF